MHVKVRDRLAAIGPVIDDKPESGIRNTFRSRDPSRRDEQVAEKFGVCGNRFRHARNHPLGDNQNMNRRLGRNIAECNTKPVLMDDVRRNFAGDDFLKDGHES